MLASVTTFALEGVSSHEVTVEVDVRRGLSTFTLVGLPDRAVRESRERVRAALLNSGLDFPQKRITVNLAPAHVRKEGPSFDLAIAVGVLAASGQVPQESLDGCALCGELSLTGELRPVRGALATSAGARRCGYLRLLVPEQNAPEAALVEEMEVHGIPSLGRIADLLHGRWTPERVQPVRAEPEGSTEQPELERRPRAGRRQAGSRDRRGRRAQPLDDRTAGSGQDDAGPATARPAAAAQLRGGARDDAGAQRRRPGERTSRDGASVSGAAPHDLGAGPRRRRAASDAGRDHARAPRRALPRRAARVQQDGGRRAASAARGRPGDDHARAARARLPGQRDGRRRVQPLPLRAAAGPMLVHRRRARALPATPERSAARPHRPRLPGRAGCPARACAPAREWPHALDPQPRGGGEGAPAGPARRDRRALQRRHGRSPDPPRGAARRPAHRPDGRGAPTSST